MKIKQKEGYADYVPIKVTLKTLEEANWFYAMLLASAYGGDDAKVFSFCQEFGLDMDKMREAEEKMSWLVEPIEVNVEITLEK